MKQSLSLRMSQHLALTPQLQQSIRLLQLSTLELSQEVEQMLDENPFLERNTDEAPQEDFGLHEADARISLGDRVNEAASDAGADSHDAAGESNASVSSDEAVTDVAESWDGDGSVDLAPDDSEWGTEAGVRKNNNNTITTRTTRTTTTVTAQTPLSWPVAWAPSQTSCIAKLCPCVCLKLTALRCVF